MSEQNLTQVNVRVLFPEFDATPAVFANHISIQSIGDIHVLGFYVALPPQGGRPRPDTTIDIPATCVARVAIPADRMIEIAKVIATNVERAQAGQQATPPEAMER